MPKAIKPKDHFNRQNFTDAVDLLKESIQLIDRIADAHRTKFPVDYNEQIHRTSLRINDFLEFIDEL